jgi:hypothetical protein
VVVSKPFAKTASVTGSARLLKAKLAALATPSTLALTA